MSKVTDKIIYQMRKDDCYRVAWLDGWLLDVVGDMVKVKREHPLNRMSAIFQHLERDKRFKKNYRISMRSDGKEARVRSFMLLEQFR